MSEKIFVWWQGVYIFLFTTTFQHMQLQEVDLQKLPRRKLKHILNDAEKSASAVNLVYTTDTKQGIIRVKKGKRFTFEYAGKQITDEQTLQRIKCLAIPPAWKNVWICPLANGHLQVTGYDALNRKQYKYHDLWTALRNHTKFYRLYHFGEALPLIRKKLQKDILLPGLPERKVLATVVSLMLKTNIRVGNNNYEKMYGSYGITTLKDKHVNIEGEQINFSFKGKKGVSHNISLRNKRLARIVKHCRDIPGKELFQYYDDEGKRQPIDSGMVNNYIKEISGGDFTAKDFRTWTGSVLAVMAFYKLGDAGTASNRRKNIVSALEVVSGHLGNTRTVCKKYYVHPEIIRLYEEDGLKKFLDLGDSNHHKDTLLKEECVLMKILSNC
jgi:DNA topoisomerase I